MTSFNLDEIVGGLHPLEVRLLRALSGHATGVEAEVAQAGELTAAQFRRAAEWLLTKGLAVVARESRDEVICVTEMGEGYRESGIPEDRIAAELQARGEIPMADFNKLEGLTAEQTFPAIGALKKKGILDVDKGVARLNDKADLGAVGKASEVLKRVCGGERVLLADLDDVQKACVRAQVHKRMRAKGILAL